MSLIIRIEKWCLIFLLLCGVLWGAFEIAMRYFFGKGWPWGDGIVVMLTVWGAMLAGAVAIEQRGHISLDILVSKLSETWRGRLDLLADLLTLLFVLTLAILSLQYLVFLVEFGGISMLTYLPAWLEFLGVPVSALFMSIHGFLNVYSGIRKRKTA